MAVEHPRPFVVEKPRACKASCASRAHFRNSLCSGLGSFVTTENRCSGSSSSFFSYSGSGPSPTSSSPRCNRPGTHNAETSARSSNAPARFAAPENPIPTSATQATILQGQSGRGPNGLATHFSARLNCISTESWVNLVSILFSRVSILVSLWWDSSTTFRGATAKPAFHLQRITSSRAPCAVRYRSGPGRGCGPAHILLLCVLVAPLHYA